jgi:hypothetical protein
VQNAFANFLTTYLSMTIINVPKWCELPEFDLLDFSFPDGTPSQNYQAPKNYFK